MLKAVDEHGSATAAPGAAAPAPGAARNGNGHKAVWPLAAQFRTSAFALGDVIDAEFNTAQLRDLAKWLDIKLKGNSKIGFIEQVAEALGARAEMTAQNQDAVLEGLTSDQQDFMRRMLTARDGDLPLSRGIAFTVWARQYERDAERRLAEMLDGLRRRALLFPTTPLQFGTRDVYYRWMPLGASTPVHTFAVDTAKVAGLNQHSANFLEAFDSFINALLRTGVDIRPQLEPHKAAARFAWLRDWEHDASDADRVINSRPGWVPDPQTGITVITPSPFTPEAAARLENQTGLPNAQSEFFYALAQSMQMIETPGSRNPTHLKLRPGAIEEWLVMAPEQKLRRVWKAWTEEVFSSLEARSAMSNARPADGFVVQRAIGARDLTPAVLAAELCALRRYVTRVLRGLPAGEWLSWDSLRDRLFEFLPECAWVFSARTDWWFAQAGSKARLNPQRRDDWNQTLGRLIEYVLRESLLWFGAVETASSDGLFEAFRITEIGAWLICKSDCTVPAALATDATEVESIAWSRDNKVLHVQPAPDRAEFVALVRRVAERGEGAFNYVITPASIEKALGDGVVLDDVTRRFKRAGVPLPRYVSDQFKLAAKRFGRVRVYQSLSVLELADELMARELSANTSLLKRAVYRISPRAFALHDDDVDALVEEMQAKGYTPRIK